MPSDKITATDRRVDILNNLVVRVTVLEEKSNDHISTIKSHDVIIDKLIHQDHELLTSLNQIAAKLELATVSIGAKSDKLIGQFNIGFKVLSACTGALILSIGGFYTYSKDLDAKYMPKFDKIVNNTALQKDNLEDIKENTEGIKDIKNNVAVQGNKLDRVSSLAQRTAAKKSVKASK